MALTEDEELGKLNGVAVSWFGYEPIESEWILVFSNGMRMVLSAGEDPEYYISGSLN